MKWSERLGYFSKGFGIALVVEKIAIWGALYTPRYSGDPLDHGLLGLIVIVISLILLIERGRRKGFQR